MDGPASESARGIYSIGAVAKMLDVSAQTLRAWEERYKQVVPRRSQGGQRLYSRNDVEQLLFIREQVERGLQPADAHRLLAERLRQQAQGPAGEAMVSDTVPTTLTVLLAERDPYAAEFADYFLRIEGYAVRIVLDAGEAGRILLEEPPDVAVVDLMISGGAGLALCRSTREQVKIPIVAVSAVETRDEALDCGVDAFLAKPFDPLQLAATIRDLLGTSAYLRTGVPR